MLNDFEVFNRFFLELILLSDSIRSTNWHIEICSMNLHERTIKIIF